MDYCNCTTSCQAGASSVFAEARKLPKKGKVPDPGVVTSGVPLQRKTSHDLASPSGSCRFLKMLTHVIWKQLSSNHFRGRRPTADLYNVGLSSSTGLTLIGLDELNARQE